MRCDICLAGTPSLSARLVRLHRPIAPKPDGELLMWGVRPSIDWTLVLDLFRPSLRIFGEPLMSDMHLYGRRHLEKMRPTTGAGGWPLSVRAARIRSTVCGRSTCRA